MCGNTKSLTHTQCFDAGTGEGRDLGTLFDVGRQIRPRGCDR